MAKKSKKSKRPLDRKIERYVDDSMGLPIVLEDSAIASSFDGEEGVVVPDVKGLEAAMAVARVIIPDKLRGEEIKFLRKAIGLKAVDLASFLDVVPETLSHWENGRNVITANPERILRMRALRALKDKARGVPAKVDDILDMEIVAVRGSLQPITLVFERMVMFVDDMRQWVWAFQGVEESDVAEEAVRDVAQSAM